MMLDLGLSKEELRELVIERAAAKIVSEMNDDDFAGFASLDNIVREEARKAAERVAEAKVLPLIEAGVQSLIIQETNRYGEATGQTYTFTEYMVARANAYLHEPVDYKGKTKSEDGFGWNKAQTRLTHLIHEHLHFTIKSAMENAVKAVKEAIEPALLDTVKTQLSAITSKLRVVP